MAHATFAALRDVATEGRVTAMEAWVANGALRAFRRKIHEDYRGSLRWDRFCKILMGLDKLYVAVGQHALSSLVSRVLVKVRALSMLLIW